MSHLLKLLLVITLGVTVTLSGKESLYILHTNSSNGNLENCHCKGHPYGTLEKRAAFIDSVRKIVDKVVVVETGDFLSPLGNPLKDKYAIRCLELIGYDAVLPGDQEFANGLTFFRENVLNSSLPIICYNLEIPEARIEPYKIITRDDVRIGITGVIAREEFQFYPDSIKNAIKIIPPEECIRSIILDLKGMVDFIVLLSHLGYDRDQEIAQNYPEIPVIIGGHSQTLLEKAQLHNRTIIAQAGRSGYYVGVLRLNLDRQKNIRTFTSQIFTLTLGMADHPEVMRLIQEYKKEREQNRRK